MKVIFENKPIEPEDKLMQEYCDIHNIPYKIKSAKQVMKNKLLSKDILLFGSVPFIKTCLSSVHIKIDEISYPDEFKSLLYRKIYKTITKRLVFNGYPLFIKPSKNIKKFTGKVVYSIDDLYGISRNEEIYVSELIDFKHEIRLYIVNKEIKSIQQYEKTHPDINGIDLSQIQNIIMEQNKYKNFVMDIAFITDCKMKDEFIMIEVNDAYSVGAYGDIACDVYFEMIYNRWQEFWD